MNQPDNSSVFRALGVNLELVARGMDTASAPSLAKHASVISDPDEPGHAEFNQALCKVASVALVQEGDAGSLQHCLFTKLATQDRWYPQFTVYSDLVLRALGRVKMAMDQEHRKATGDALVKSAGPLSLLGSAGKATMSLTPSMIRTILSVGLIGGAGGGALTWQAGRAASEDDAEIEAMKAKRDIYKRLAYELKARAQDADLSDADVRSAVGSLY